MTDAPLALVADLGATNARFALIGPEGARDVEILRCADYPSLAAAITAYLEMARPVTRPVEAAVAIACPTDNDLISMTNHNWTFSVSEMRREMGFDRLEVINDFTAIALSVPHLRPADRVQIGGGAPRGGFPIGIIGPGTGLGVSGLVPAATGWTALAGEGGHVTVAAVTARESEVLGRLRQRFTHVSAERVISGMGLVNLYETLAAIDGEADALMREPAQITEAARGGTDPLCVEAVEMFCAMLGTVAGNLALTLGSLGGVFIAGGIVPKLGPLFAGSAFRERFEAKGRLRFFLANVPTYVVTHPLPALIGLHSVLQR